MAELYTFMEKDFEKLSIFLEKSEKFTFFEDGKLLINIDAKQQILVHFENQEEAQTWLTEYFGEFDPVVNSAVQ